MVRPERNGQRAGDDEALEGARQERTEAIERHYDYMIHPLQTLIAATRNNPVAAHRWAHLTTLVDALEKTKRLGRFAPTRTERRHVLDAMQEFANFKKNTNRPMVWKRVFLHACIVMPNRDNLEEQLVVLDSIDYLTEVLRNADIYEGNLWLTQFRCAWENRPAPPRPPRNFTTPADIADALTVLLDTSENILRAQGQDPVAITATRQRQWSDIFRSVLHDADVINEELIREELNAEVALNAARARAAQAARAHLARAENP